MEAHQGTGTADREEGNLPAAGFVVPADARGQLTALFPIESEMLVPQRAELRGEVNTAPLAVQNLTPRIYLYESIVLGSLQVGIWGDAPPAGDPVPGLPLWTE